MKTAHLSIHGPFKLRPFKSSSRSWFCVPTFLFGVTSSRLERVVSPCTASFIIVLSLGAG